MNSRRASRQLLHRTAMVIDDNLPIYVMARALRQRVVTLDPRLTS
jgi:hypothetical protein